MGPDQEDQRRQEFEETALVHMQSIYSTALRLIRNKTDAEDLFQETFLRAYRFFHQFRSGTDCRAWLLPGRGDEQLTSGDSGSRSDPPVGGGGHRTSHRRASPQASGGSSPGGYRGL